MQNIHVLYMNVCEGSVKSNAYHLHKPPIQKNSTNILIASKEKMDRISFFLYHFPQNLVDGSWFLECTFLHDLWPLLFHEQHESIQWLLNMRLLFLLLRHYHPCKSKTKLTHMNIDLVIFSLTKAFLLSKIHVYANTYRYIKTLQTKKVHLHVQISMVTNPSVQ